jgi:nitrogen fixation/metabolism regulation signal transduction histidine kinase
MVMMSASVTSTPAAGATHHHRSVKNYLLDFHFQVKYTAYIAAVAVVLSTALGALLWSVSGEVIAQSQRTVRQGQDTVRRGQELVRESQKVSAVVRMNIVRDPVYGSNPELAAIFNQSANEQDAQLQAEQRTLEMNAKALEQRAVQLAAQKDKMFLGLVAVLSLLVIGVSLAGIVVTHRVAGPIFKMKRLLAHVGEGHLRMREKLRKGDELQHFFVAFERMVESLRQRQQQEIDKLSEAIGVLEKTVPADQLDRLLMLRREMQGALESVGPEPGQSAPSPATPSGSSAS